MNVNTVLFNFKKLKNKPKLGGVRKQTQHCLRFKCSPVLTHVGHLLSVATEGKKGLKGLPCLHLDTDTEWVSGHKAGYTGSSHLIQEMNLNYQRAEF